MPAKDRLFVKFLRSAFGASAMAQVRYRLWARHCKSQNISRLFAAISFAEQVHADNHFRELGEDAEEAVLVVANAIFGFGEADEMLRRAMDDELNEADQLNMMCREIARLHGSKELECSFGYESKAKRNYIEFFGKALISAKRDNDASFNDLYVCMICGHLMEGDKPGKCPECSMSSDHFAAFPVKGEYRVKN